MNKQIQESFICNHWDYCPIKKITTKPQNCAVPDCYECETHKYYERYGNIDLGIGAMVQPINMESAVNGTNGK